MGRAHKSKARKGMHIRGNKKGDVLSCFWVIKKRQRRRDLRKGGLDGFTKKEVQKFEEKDIF